MMSFRRYYQSNISALTPPSQHRLPSPPPPSIPSPPYGYVYRSISQGSYSSYDYTSYNTVYEAYSYSGNYNSGYDTRYPEVYSQSNTMDNVTYDTSLTNKATKYTRRFREFSNARKNNKNNSNDAKDNINTAGVIDISNSGGVASTNTIPSLLTVLHGCDPVTKAVINNVFHEDNPKAPLHKGHLKCDDCNISNLTREMLTSHLNGLRHKRKLKEKEVTISPDDLAKDGVIVKPRSGMNPQATYVCTFCNLEINNPIPLKSHIEGTRHKHKKIEAEKEAKATKRGTVNTKQKEVQGTTIALQNVKQGITNTSQSATQTTPNAPQIANQGLTNDTQDVKLGTSNVIQNIPSDIQNAKQITSNATQNAQQRPANPIPIPKQETSNANQNLNQATLIPNQAVKRQSTDSISYEKDKINEPAAKKEKYECVLCGVFSNSEITQKEHLQSRRHILKVENQNNPRFNKPGIGFVRNLATSTVTHKSQINTNIRT